MQVRDMFLKNENCLFGLVVVIFFLFSFKISANSDNKIIMITHLSSLKNFSASFLQSDGENLSEGKVYIGKERVRAEYLYPEKILIILDQDKAMYYNYELEEDEFFNPQNTNAWFFYDIFRNPVFFQDGLITEKNNELILEKRGVDNEKNDFVIKVKFEKKPLILRSMEILIADNFLKLSIFNHSYNEEFSKDFFKLINPKLLN